MNKNYSLKEIENHYLVEKVEKRRDEIKTYKVILKNGEILEETFIRDVSIILKMLELADKQRG